MKDRMTCLLQVGREICKSVNAASVSFLGYIGTKGQIKIEPGGRARPAVSNFRYSFVFANFYRRFNLNYSHDATFYGPINKQGDRALDKRKSKVWMN